MIALVLSMAVIFGAFIPWAIRNDNAGELAEYDGYES